MSIEQISEMPIRIGDIGNLFNSIKEEIDSAIHDKNIQPQKLGYNVYKITDGKIRVYYFMENNIIIGGVLMRNVKDGLFQVDVAGKNPYYKNRAPYVSNLYPHIIDDLSPNEALLSGTQLSTNGLRLWKRLVKMYPQKVSVYDKIERTVSPIENSEQLNMFTSVYDTRLGKYLFMIRGQNNEDTERIQKLAGIKKE